MKTSAAETPEQSGLFEVGDWLLSTERLSPKLNGGWATFYWHGPEKSAYWSQDPQEAHTFSSPEAAVHAWNTHIEQSGDLPGRDVRAVVRPCKESEKRP